MNSIEKIIYDVVKKNPRMKDFVRDFYQTIFSVFPVKQYVINESLINRSGYFFGFHDKSPWCFEDTYLLANKFFIPNRNIKADDFIEVGIFVGESNKEFVSLAKTNSFNWQQGCMLQWVGEKKQIVFNSYEDDRHVSTIINIKGEVIKKILFPISALSPDGKYALSYSFARLRYYAPGYGYENGIDEESELKIPQRHGLTIIETETGEAKQLFTVAEIAAINPNETMQGAFHYFSHCLFSPEGNRFVFYHRWIRHMNVVHTRMFSCDLNGDNKYLFPTNGMVSHIGWRNKHEILAYSNTSTLGDGYILFEEGLNKYDLIGKDIFTSDGHPSFSPANNNRVITDTYPNRFRQCTLILYDFLKNKKYDLAKLRQPLQFKNELRCDLHPRWNRAGTMVCFDSAHSGIRSLCTLDLKKELKNWEND